MRLSLLSDFGKQSLPETIDVGVNEGTVGVRVGDGRIVRVSIGVLLGLTVLLGISVLLGVKTILGVSVIVGVSVGC